MSANPAVTRHPNLPRATKAAMVVQLLLRNGGDLPLAQLPPAAQARLTRELGALNLVDKDTLKGVAIEFSRELSNVGMTAPGSMEAALKSLEGRISETIATQLRVEAAGGANTDPWDLVLTLETEDLVPIATDESAEVAAVMLSKLPTAKAASLLGQLPGPLARKVAFAMSRTTSIRADAIARIGAGLAQAYCGASIPAFAQTAESRIGAILNSSPAATRDQILEGLMTEDQTFGEGVRRAIFTFEDIPARLAAIDVPKVLRDVDQADLVRALSSAAAAGGPLAAAADHLLGNVSNRLADSLREEMEDAGVVKQAEGEAAQTAVITSIRSAVDAGTIALILPDEDEDP